MLEKIFSKQIVLLVLLILAPLAYGKSHYYCPMRCEAKRTYEKAGVCPVCKMALDKEDEEIRYTLETKTENLEAGKEATIHFFPKPGKMTSPIEIDIVTQDLSLLQSVSVPSDSEGNFSLKRRFDAGGNFLLFARFTPEGGKRQMVPAAIQVVPAHPSVFDFQKDPSKKRAGISFSSSKKGKKTTVQFSFDDIKEAQALMRLIVVSEDTLFYFESDKPSKKTARSIAFTTELPSSGYYRVWLESRGKPPVPFTLGVR